MTNPENDIDLVPESHGPFGDYYVHPAKLERSQQLKAALEALEEEIRQCTKTSFIVK